VQKWARAGLGGEPRRPAGELSEDVPRRPPKGERPQCPVICPDGHRCRARCWWPKGTEGPSAACSGHLAVQLAADEPPRKLPDKEFQSGVPAPTSAPTVRRNAIGPQPWFRDPADADRAGRSDGPRLQRLSRRQVPVRWLPPPGRWMTSTRPTAVEMAFSSTPLKKPPIRPIGPTSSTESSPAGSPSRRSRRRRGADRRLGPRVRNSKGLTGGPSPIAPDSPEAAGFESVITIPGLASGPRPGVGYRPRSSLNRAISFPKKPPPGPPAHC
jgi:hypothetical protein